MRLLLTKVQLSCIANNMRESDNNQLHPNQGSNGKTGQSQLEVDSDNFNNSGSESSENQQQVCRKYHPCGSKHPERKSWHSQTSSNQY